MNVSRRRYMGGEEKLPYDAEIEYLQSSGHQKISLPLSGIVADVFFEVSGRVYPLQGANGYTFITTPTSQAFLLRGYSSSLYASTIGGAATNGGIGLVSNRYTDFSLSTEGKTVNGTFQQIKRPIKSNYLFNKITIFNGDFIRVCWLKIKIGTNYVYDLIPVRIGTVGYLYDKISGELFGNEGTVAFTIGPDV